MKTAIDRGSSQLRGAEPPDADVVILGAGPAGSSAARLLAAWGHEVVVVTRAPAGPALAESLPPSCAKLLDRVGVREAVDAAGFLRSTGNTVRWVGGAERVERFQDGALGYQVPRDRFDALLLSEAVAAGASTIVGASGSVASGADALGRTTVRYRSPGRAGSVRARWVLDCTGRRGAVRRGERRPGGGAPRTLALAGVWEAARWALPDESHTLVESYAGGWAWSVPVTPGRRFVTVMVDPSLTRLRGRRLIDAEYREQLQRTEWIGPVVTSAARRVGVPWACDATQRSAEEVVSDGVLRVGDAASFVDPLSSFGIKKALASAWLAAVVVNTCLADPALATAATALYEERERAMYRVLTRRSAALAADAEGTHPGAFWRSRLDVEDHGGDEARAPGEPDAAQLREDPRVQAAFAEIRARESVRLQPGPSAMRAPRPVVAGNRVVLRDHLVLDAFPAGVRFIRNVDLLLLLSLAPEHEQVGELYEAYVRAGTPVPLPDFLGALSTLVASEALVFA